VLTLSTLSTHASVLALAAALASPAAAAGDAPQPALVPAPVEAFFVPLGYDDNDNVEVVVHGRFPNTCYKVGPANATVDVAARTVEVEATAFHYQAAGCALVLVPFTQTVALGLLPEGTYTVSI